MHCVWGTLPDVLWDVAGCGACCFMWVQLIVACLMQLMVACLIQHACLACMLCMVAVLSMHMCGKQLCLHDAHPNPRHFSSSTCVLPMLLLHQDWPGKRDMNGEFRCGLARAPVSGPCYCLERFMGLSMYALAFLC